MQLKPNTKADVLTIPTKLPLLEGLCWNIAYPYQLTPQEMLSIYEQRWRFKDMLGEPSTEEIEFIQYLTSYYHQPSLFPETLAMDKQQFYDLAIKVLQDLDSQLLLEHQTYFGGGTMLCLEQDRYRLSYDLDFLCNMSGYKRLRQWFNDHSCRELFVRGTVIGIPDEVRRDQYSIRFPVTVSESNTELAIKLEFIVETRFELEVPQINNITNLASISLNDRFTSKLMANADRWNDSSTYARDLIDLAILRRQSSIPDIAIARAEAVYQVNQPLIEAIKRFQASAKLRQQCYETLRIDNPIVVIDGIDLLARDYNLGLTKREFNETDFSYLEPK